MSSAIGPFAVDEGLVKAAGSEALVRIYNTNTNKMICVAFPLETAWPPSTATSSYPACPAPARRSAGISRAGRCDARASCCRRATRRRSTCRGSARSGCRWSMPPTRACSSSARDVGLAGIEMPEALDGTAGLLKKLGGDTIAASVAMGIAGRPRKRPKARTVPFVGFVSGPQDAPTLSGESIRGGRRPHRAHDVERPAASRASADDRAVHGGGGADHRHRRPRSHPAEHRIRKPISAFRARPVSSPSERA